MKETHLKFAELGLAEPILRAVAAEGYSTPTPIQTQAIPHVLAGRDLLGCAQTGTGKTAAFALPILHRLTHAGNPPAGSGRKIRVLVLSPTRELAAQISECISAYGRNTPLKHAVIYGGVNQNPQVRALKHGIDILVATPGRLLDLINQGYVDLRGVEVFVLDEADRMLDLGFLPDIRKIVARIPKQRQTLFFSATMPADIRKLADTILHDPVSINVAPTATTAERIEQSVYHVSKKDKPILLVHCLNNLQVTRALIFTRTKRGADRVTKELCRAGIRAAAIHGDKTQANRERALFNFKSSRTPILVATDIAARGIDVDAISHVFNFDIPNVAETYIHRIGRTARAGASGIAISFCDVEEQSDLKAIERLIRVRVPVQTDHPDYPARAEQPADAAPHSRPPRRPQGSSRRPQDSRAAKKPGQRPRHTHGSSSNGGSTPSYAPAPSGVGYRSRGRRRTSRKPATV